MNKQERQLQARLKWVEMYEELGHAAKTCYRYGISRPTLRLWVRRYQADGIGGLRDRSRRPQEKKENKPEEKLTEMVMTSEVEGVR